MNETMDKYEKLKQILKDLGSVAVAFSGGVDSTFLLKTAYDVLGGNVIAVTARHHAVPESEQQLAADFCKELGVGYYPIVVDEMTIPGFPENPPDRCYLCKKEIFTRLMQTAAQIPNAKGLCSWQIVDGSNADDTGDYRTGMRAIQELRVRSPLMEAGLGKQEIRELSHMLKLPTWNMPSFACLASRFAYGETITREKLHMVELAEEYLKKMGFSQYRVRVHGSLARIEVLSEQLPLLMEKREPVNTYLRSLGFLYVTMDLGGFVSGSMNRTLQG